jgi:hypothetical protein
VTTYWRCLECDRTWTIPSCAAVSRTLANAGSFP